LIRYTKLYFWYLRANWLSLMAYPVSFISVNLAGIVYSLASVAGVYLIWVSLGMLGKRDPMSVLWVFASAVAGSVIHASVHIIANATAFYVVQNRGIAGLAWTLDEFSRYPLDIYHKGIRAFLTWLAPFGFASFYPAQAIFNNYRSLWLARLSPLVAVVAFLTAYSFWSKALRSYQGVGN